MFSFEIHLIVAKLVILLSWETAAEDIFPVCQNPLQDILSGPSFPGFLDPPLHIAHLDNIIPMVIPDDYSN